MRSDRPLLAILAGTRITDLSREERLPDVMEMGGRDPQKWREKGGDPRG